MGNSKSKSARKQEEDVDGFSDEESGDRWSDDEPPGVAVVVKGFFVNCPFPDDADDEPAFGEEPVATGDEKTYRISTSETTCTQLWEMVRADFPVEKDGYVLHDAMVVLTQDSDFVTLEAGPGPLTPYGLSFYPLRACYVKKSD